jgi:hypothetical protein
MSLYFVRVLFAQFAGFKNPFLLQACFAIKKRHAIDALNIHVASAQIAGLKDRLDGWISKVASTALALEQETVGVVAA